MVSIGEIPAQQPDRIVYSKNGGTQIVQEWKGPATLMAGLVAQLRVNFDEVSTDERDGVVTVRGMNRAPIGYEVESPVINFDLVSEAQTLDLGFSAYFAAVSDELIIAINSAFSDSKKTSAEKLAVVTAQHSLTGGDLEKAKKLLALRERGQDSYVDYSWSFTRTVTVSRYYPARIILTGHGTLWTTQNINDYCGTLPLITLPNTEENAAQSNLGLRYRWQRHQSQVQINSAGNFNLVEGWRLALWNTNVYADYVPPT